MKYSILWSEFSESQIDEIFDYYNRTASRSVAKKIVLRIIVETQILETTPAAGQVEELLVGRAEAYRYLVCGNYKVIYSVDNKHKLVKIADVFDTRQNPIKMKRKK